MKQTRCDLCADDAAVYCDPDAAYLCWACDAAVHGANFIVSRHIRRVACASCRSLDDRRSSGVPVTGPLPSGARSVLCRACDPDPPGPPSPTAPSASSSSCMSTTSESTAPAPPWNLAAKRRRRRLGGEDGSAEDVLLSWSRRMGLPRPRRCAAVAVDAVVAVGEGTVAALPFRVALAAALWFAVKRSEEDTSASGGRGAVLRRLEACSGVPARLVAVAEWRIARSAGRVRVVAEEGWAECS